MIPATCHEQTTPLETSECCVKMILYVEDDAFVRDVTQEILESAGYRVLSAADGAEAQRICRDCCGKIDLLLTDVILPGESGWVLAAKLQRDNPTLKTLYVTGYPQQAGILRSQSEHCLLKPFSTLTLLNRVKQSIWTNAARPCSIVGLRAPASPRRTNDMSRNIR